MGTEDLVQWDKVKGLEKTKLDTLVASRRKVVVEMRQVKAKLDEISLKLLNALMKVGVKSVGVGDVRVTFKAGGPTEKLDKKKLYTSLLEQGVKPQVVEKAFKAATKPGKDREPSILVTDPELKEQEEE